jgi:N-acetylneuraminic acid mutarotase
MGGGTWEPAPTLPGGARQEVGVTAWRHLVFVLGGQGSGATRNEAFNTQTGMWEMHTPLPAGTGVDHPNVAATDTKVYVIGGNGQGGTTNRTLEYDPMTRMWTEKAQMPTARNASATAAIGTKVYVAGGSPTAASRVLEAFDTAANTWERLPDLPAPGRNHVPGVALGGLLYVIAGRTGGPSDGLQNRVDVYDPNARTWSMRAPAPTARGGCGAGVVNGIIYVVGGEGAPRGTYPTGVFPQTESYNPMTDRWTVHPNMRTPRHGMGAAGVGGKLYVPAGATMQGGGTAVPVMEIFTP